MILVFTFRSELEQTLQDMTVQLFGIKAVALTIHTATY